MAVTRHEARGAAREPDGGTPGYPMPPQPDSTALGCGRDTTIFMGIPRLPMPIYAHVGFVRGKGPR